MSPNATSCMMCGDVLERGVHHNCPAKSRRVTPPIAPNPTDTEKLLAPMRYDMEQRGTYECYGVMEPYGQHGDWIRSEDFDAVAAKVRELQGQIDRMRVDNPYWEVQLRRANQHADAMTAERDAALAQVARMHRRVYAPAAGDCPFCDLYPATGHAQQVPQCPLCHRQECAEDDAAAAANQPAKGA